MDGEAIDFKNFEKEYLSGKLEISVDLTTSRDWLLNKGPHCYTIWWIVGIALSWTPFIITIIYAVYALFNNRLLLLSLPLFPLLFLISSPYADKIGIIRFIKILSLLGLIYTMSIHSSWTVMFAWILGIFLSMWLLNRFAYECLLTTILDHEDFFNLLCNNRKVLIKRT